MYIEYSKKEETNPPIQKEFKWRDFGGRINPGRNYFMFGIMCKGVRNETTFSFPERGKPDDMAYASRNDSLIYISDSDTPSEGSVTLEKAKQWEKYGNKIINNSEGKPTWVEHPDWHSHSWLTTDEFEKVLEFYKKNDPENEWVEPEYEAVLSSMKRFEELGYNARIVFWFDN